jgi:hypothetical protein
VASVYWLTAVDALLLAAMNGPMTFAAYPGLTGHLSINTTIALINFIHLRENIVSAQVGFFADQLPHRLTYQGKRIYLRFKPLALVMQVFIDAASFLARKLGIFFRTDDLAMLNQVPDIKHT